MKTIYRYIYVFFMMRAIRLSRFNDHYVNKLGGSKADGLRVIRRFEEVNGLSFNPFKTEHINRVKGMARHTAFFRRVRLHFRGNQNDQ